MDWRDLRIALALSRHPSYLDAGRALGMDPTTVGRRVAALEEALGVKLFSHTPTGWRPTVAGERVLAHATRMADEARAIQRVSGLSTEKVEGTVRLTTLDEVATWLLVPRLGALRERHPELVVDLRCTEQVLDLVAGRADIAVRLARPTEEGVRIRRLGTVEFGIFATTACAARAGLHAPDPEATPDLVALGSTERPLPETRWLLHTFPRGRVVMRTNSVPTAYDAVRAGVGVGAMAVSVAAASDLLRIDDGRGAVERPVWRVVPEAIAETPAIRAVCEWLDELGEGMVGD